MLKAGNVQRRIAAIERFGVLILHPYGRDVNDNRGDLPLYNKFVKAAPGSVTVNQWKRRRFAPGYPQFVVTVLNCVGKPVNGNSKLTNVRATYE